MSSDSFNKITEAIAESVYGIIDSRIENVKKLIEKLDGSQKMLSAGRESQIENLKSHVDDLETELRKLTGHELATVENLQKEVDELSQKLLDIEQNTQALRAKLEK